MCGRYGRRADKQQIAEHYYWRRRQEQGFADQGPDFNITPDSFQPVVRLDAETGDREVTLMKWGMVPYWSKEPKAGFSSINARDDSLATSGAWREPWRKSRRCLIPAEFFYEWEPLTPEDKRAKASKPWAVSLTDDRLFSFGGIYDRWKDKQTGHLLESFAIITVDPNEVLERFHNRCPLIIEPRDYERWLAPSGPEQLPADLLRTYPAEGMKAWRVNPIKGNGPGLLEPYAELPGLFG